MSDHKHWKSKVLVSVEQNPDGSFILTCVRCGATLGPPHVTRESALCEVSMQPDWELEE